MTTRVTQTPQEPFFFSIVVFGSFFSPKLEVVNNHGSSKEKFIGYSEGIEEEAHKTREEHRNFVAYLKSDAYLFSPLISDSPPFATEIDTHPPLRDLPLAGFDELGTKRVNKKKKEKKRRMLEKAKEYLKSDCYMYGPMISSSKLGSSLKGELQITNLVAVEVSKSATTMREDIRSYKHLLSGNTEQALRNGRIDFTKQAELD